MQAKKLFLSVVIFGISCLFFTGCGQDSAKFFLEENNINYFKLENTTDLSSLGEAMAGTKNCIVALDADQASYVLDSLASIGEVSAENLAMEFNLNGEGDFSKLSALSAVKGLTTLTVAGENENDDVSVYAELSDLTTLTLKDQKISDYTPLERCPNLTTLSLAGNTINYTSLTRINMADVEVPVAENNWVALDLLKANQGITTLNRIPREQYNVGSLLEGEQHYYYLQFSGVSYVSKKKQEITVSGGEQPSAITGAVAVAGTKNLLKENQYAEQALLNTYCGFDEAAASPAVFFPLIKDYTEADAAATMVNMAGTDYMEENFITAVTPEDAAFIFYVYALDGQDNLTSDYTAAGTRIYGQFYDVKGGKYYAPVLILDTPMTDTGTAAYQEEVRNGVNEILKGYSVNTL